jgi:hypothetical protein
MVQCNDSRSRQNTALFMVYGRHEERVNLNKGRTFGRMKMIHPWTNLLMTTILPTATIQSIKKSPTGDDRNGNLSKRLSKPRLFSAIDNRTYSYQAILKVNIKIQSSLISELRWSDLISINRTPSISSSSFRPDDVAPRP